MALSTKQAKELRKLMTQENPPKRLTKSDVEMRTKRLQDLQKLRRRK